MKKRVKKEWLKYRTKSKDYYEKTILNIPNPITFLRVVLTLILIYMFIFDFPVLQIMIIFIIAAFTDFLDGLIARGFVQVTKFGAKFDILADRFLWITTGLCILIFLPMNGIFDKSHLTQMFLILTREILCLPFVFLNLIKGEKVLIAANWSGKITTALQGFAIPSLVLSTQYAFFGYAPILAFITCLSGIWAARDYLKGTKFL